MCVHVCAAISLHKIKRSVTEIKSVIELLDVERLRQEEVDILIKIAPTEEEVQYVYKLGITGVCMYVCAW